MASSLLKPFHLHDSTLLVRQTASKRTFTPGLSDNSGFALIEILVALVIGL
ncbi:prepilin-type N-terminal cleavage/methylation domain-containing protein, partial [bacterium]|nr:prepilin-type N-terminal cleavage/methylation domain-containing protein [bacterium]